MPKPQPKYTLGLDFGTNSVRALIVDVRNGREVATAVFDYPTGEAGIILDPSDPNLARQHPGRLPQGRRGHGQEGPGPGPQSRAGLPARRRSSASASTRPAARRCRWTQQGTPLAFKKQFAKNPAAMAWLWKDHTGVAEAAEITALAAKPHPQYLAKCGGTYSSEWFFSKILHCLRDRPRRSSTPPTSWVECCRLDPGRCSPAPRRRPRRSGGRLRRRPQGHVQRRLGRLPGRGVPGQARSRSWARCATGSATEGAHRRPRRRAA